MFDFLPFDLTQLLSFVSNKDWAFVHPWAFSLLFLPLFITWFAPSYKERRQSVQVPYFTRLVDITGETPQHGAVVNRRKNAQRILLVFGWLCIVTSMAKPEIIGAPIVQEKSARDLMVAVDLSASMMVEDFVSHDGVHTKDGSPETAKKVNRLVAVKQVLADFAKKRTHDRLGFILFGDAAYLQAPFTSDISTWLKLLNESEIGMAGQSTAFGDAIGLAINVFQQTEVDNKVLIVLTDGNDTRSKVPPIEAAKVASAYHIKIYAIAIGDPEAVGEEKVDVEVLEQLTKITGGASFHAMNRAELTEVYQIIDGLEPQLFSSQSHRPRTDVFYYPMVLYTLVNLLALFIVILMKKVKRKTRSGSPADTKDEANG